MQLGGSESYIFWSFGTPEPFPICMENSYAQLELRECVQRCKTRYCIETYLIKIVCYFHLFDCTFLFPEDSLFTEHKKCQYSEAMRSYWLVGL